MLTLKPFCFWTGFYIIGTSVMKELKNVFLTKDVDKWRYFFLDISKIWFLDGKA